MKYQNTTFSDEGLERISSMTFKEFGKLYKGVFKDLKKAFKDLGGGKTKESIKESESYEEREK